MHGKIHFGIKYGKLILDIQLVEASEHMSIRIESDCDFEWPKITIKKCKQKERPRKVMVTKVGSK